jgi:type II restriction enzyme
LINFLKTVTNLKDYLTGVEVGLDTHARKNRSGSAMELAVLPLMQTLVESNKGLSLLFQKQFKDVEKSWGLSVPTTLRERRFDYVIKKDKTLINIEVNFFAGGGSKPQEIVDSYINRQNELYAEGWKFIWITDGRGWKAGKNQIQRAIKEIDYVLNLDFVRRGLLEHIIRSY